MIQEPAERREPDRDDGAPHPLLADALSEARAGVSAEHPAGRHREGDRPVDDPSEREHDDGHAVDAGPAPVLEPVHAMDVGESREPQGSEHEDADAGAEVTAVHGDEELRHEEARAWSFWLRARYVQPPQEGSLDEKQRGRPQHEERYDPGKRGRGGMKQQPRTQGAAAHTRHREVDHPATRADELAPVTPHPSERAPPERHRARGIGHGRRYPERDDS